MRLWNALSRHDSALQQQLGHELAAERAAGAHAERGPALHRRQTMELKRYELPRVAKHLKSKSLHAEVPEFEPARKSTHMNPGAQEFKPATKFVSTSVALTLPTNSELTSKSTFNVFLTGVPTGVNTGSGSSRRQQQRGRRAERKEDIEHYRVLLEHAVDDDSDQEEEEESHVILFELPDLRFFGTVSSELSRIPDFQISAMEEQEMPKPLLEKAVAMVEEEDRKIIPRKYDFWSAYTCSRMGLEDVVVDVVDGEPRVIISTILKILVRGMVVAS